MFSPSRARFGRSGHLARLMRYLPAYSPITRFPSCFAINPVGCATSRSTTPLSTTSGRRHPEENDTFNHALAELRGEEHQQIADAYDWTGTNTLVDVGGGIGSLLAAIMGSRPKIHGVLVEQPELLPGADRLLRDRGVRDRCELLAGNFFKNIAATGEVWTLSQVLHDWPDAKCLEILRRCREAMRPEDRLLVIEM